jgi:hypothetical protein
MHRLLKHSSNPAVWLEECAVFYSHLRNNGNPSKAIDSTFRTVNWNQRSKMLEPKKRVEDDQVFAQYRGCVFSNRSAPESAELRAETELSLEELQEQGQGCEIPPHAPSSRSGACSRWDKFCLGELFAISMGLPWWPQNREYSRSLL